METEVLELRRDAAELEDLYGKEALEKEIAREREMFESGYTRAMKAFAEAREAGREADTPHGRAVMRMLLGDVGDAVRNWVEKAANKPGRAHSAVKYLRVLDPDVIAFIGLRSVIDDVVSRRRPLQSVAIRIGARIADEILISRFAEEDERGYKFGLERAMRYRNIDRRRTSMRGLGRDFFKKVENISEAEKLHIGSAVIDILVGLGLVTVEEEIYSRSNTIKQLAATRALVEWIQRNAERVAVLSPIHGPMVVPPLDWTSPYNGGYLTKQVQGRANLVKTGNKAYLTELESAEMAAVYEAVNALQRTPWQINKAVLRAYERVLETDLPLGGLPARGDVEYCPCPVCGESVKMPKTLTKQVVEKHRCLAEDEEALRKWKTAAYEIHKDNVSRRGKLLHVMRIISTAKSYADEPAIYIPYQLDFRGRVYAIPSPLNPQGSDIAKGLLRFAEGKPIEDGVAAGWLAVHGANTFGYDKVSLEGRIAWVEEHEEEILASAEDPVANRFWCDADKPAQFLAFCFEWAGFVREGYGFVSHLPIHLDGSCSGIQHYSAMLRDEVGARAVNLLPAERPNDIYQEVCNVAVRHVIEDVRSISSTIAERGKGKIPLELVERILKAVTTGSNDCNFNSSTTPSEKETSNPYNEVSLKGVVDVVEVNEALGALATVEDRDEVDEEMKLLYGVGWLLLEPDRKATKRQVMTLPYGSTSYSCREYTEDWYKSYISSSNRNCTTPPFPKSVERHAVTYFSSIIWRSIGEVVVGAREAMSWLQKCASVVASEGLPVYWETPVGFPVMQAYYDVTPRRVKTVIGESIIKLSIVEDEESDKIDKRKMRNGIAPNFVHSLDASHLVLTVGWALDNGITNFAVVHDSFGVHAADTQLFSVCIRKAFVELYSVDVLELMREQIIRQVDPKDRDKIPPCPAKGNLDILQVLDAEYFFA